MQAAGAPHISASGVGRVFFLTPPLLPAPGFGYGVRPDLERAPCAPGRAGDVAEWLKATVC